MNEEIEKKLKELARLVGEDADFLPKWRANIDAFFSDEILTAEDGFKERFEYLYKNKDHDTTGSSKALEEAEQLINASDDEKKAEYEEQLQAFREQHEKNLELYESIEQDIQKKYSVMEAAAAEKIEEALNELSDGIKTEFATAVYFPQLEEVLQSIPDYDYGGAAYNSKFWDDYDSMKRLKNILPPYQGGEIGSELQGMIDFLGEEKKTAYKEQLKALDDKQNEAMKAYQEVYAKVNRKFKAMDEVRDMFDYRFNNILRGAVDRFRTSDLKVDEEKSSDEYKAMRTAVKALVGEDGEAKKLNDPEAQKELYQAAYDACNRYVKVKSGKFSKLSHNGSRRLEAANDMMTAITALYPEFKKSKSKTKEVDPKKKKR